MLLGGVASAYTDYSNTWFNIDSFDENSAAVKQQKNALWNTPQARLARMEVMMTQFREMEKLVAFWTEHGMDGKPVEADAAREKAYVVVRNNARRQADAALKAKPVQQLLEAADDLDEAAWLQSMTPELTRGLVCALEEQFDCFDWRGDGRDARRAELLSKALEQAGWLRSKGMDDKKYAAAQTSALLHRAAHHMASGMSGGAAFRQATADVHGASSISSPATSSGVAAWSGPGTPMEPQTLGLLYNKKTLAAAKKMLEAMLTHQGLTLNSQNSGIAGLSYSGNTAGGGVAGGSAGAPPVAVSPAELWFRLLGDAAPAAEAENIEVAENTIGWVTKETDAASVTLQKNATLNVTDSLTLSGTMTVEEGSKLVVKDGGVVQLSDYADYKTDWEKNKETALLFNALLNSTLTEGSGVVKINSVSVQFGHDGKYNLLDGSTTNINATFNAHYQIAQNLTLQNFKQGAEGKPSLWKIGSQGVVEVDGNLYLASYQQLDVEKGAYLEVKGIFEMGHEQGTQYKAKLTMADGSKVVLGQIGDKRTQNDGQSQLVMTGGELTFTHEGDAVTHTLGGVSLQGGTLNADGNNWTLNNNATLGSETALLTIQTDADHTITLGGTVLGSTNPTTTTLAGNVAVTQGSHAALNGIYQGSGSINLADNSTLALDSLFSAADGAALAINGTGAVRLAGSQSTLTDGFNETYTLTYTLSGHQGVTFADTLQWQDDKGNAITNMVYNEDTGTFSGQVDNADKTLYYIVTKDHMADYTLGGTVAKATGFEMRNNGGINIGAGMILNDKEVNRNGHTLTLAGKGDFVINGFTMPAQTQFKKDGEDKWAGAVVISGSVGGNKVQSFNGLYQEGSVIAMNGFDGIPEEWYNKTLNAGIRLDAPADGSPAWRWNSGSVNAVSTTFTGDWSGEGDFVLGAKGGSTWKQNFIYKGDISGWSGRFLVESGVTDVTLSGNVKDVYAELDKGKGTGTLNLKSEVDAVFHANATVNSLSVSDTHKITLDKGTEMHVTNALPSGTQLGQKLQTTYFNHVSGDGTLFLNFGSSIEDQMSITAGETVTPDVNTVFVGDGAKQNLAISMWGATSGGLNLDHTFMVVDEMTLQWGAGLTLGKTTSGVGQLVSNTLHMGHFDGKDKPARVTISGGTAMLGQIDISSTHKNTFNMTSGVLEITSSGNAVSKSTTGTDNTVFTLAGGTLRADGTKWVWNHDAVIGAEDGSALSVETLNGGAITIGAAGVTSTLVNTIDNHGTLTLDGTVNITMDASDKANGYVDQDGNFGMSVGFAATLQMPGAATYQVVTGNAATLGENIVWKANGQTLNVVPADTPNASNDSYYFDGYNLRLVNEVSEAAPERVGTVYYVGGRGGDYHFDKAENAAIVTGFDIANGTLHVDVSPEHNVSLALGYGTLDMGENVAITVDKQSGWNMDAGASVVLGSGAVLTLPGVHPETKADSYKVYQLLNNSTGSGTIVFDGTLDVQFGNAGHNFVSPDSYNILEDNGTAATTGVNADIKTNIVVNGNMLIQNYRQGKDHPDVGSWWKVSEGGSLTVHGNLDSSSYQKVSVEGGSLVVDGTYKIGHPAGREYEGDLELKSGSLSVGTFETEHEDTSTVHISGGKLTVTKGNAFANTFREVSARDAEFEGSWTWNHDATIGNLTITAGSNITLGTAETTLTLESPIAANNGALTLDGTFIINMEPTEGGDVYGTDSTGYTKDGDGYLKNLGDVYTLVKEGNDASIGSHLTFELNGETLTATKDNFDGKSIILNGSDPGTVYYLNTATGYTYTADDTRTTAFELVNTEATLRLERELSGIETIHALGGTVSLGEGVTMNAALLHAENTVTMKGEGVYRVHGNNLMVHPDSHHVSFADEGWTGTVQMNGQLGNSGTLNELGNAGSWVELNGVSGADAAAALDVNITLTDNDSEAAWSYAADGHSVMVNGKWAGDGTFAFEPEIGAGSVTQKLDYRGDISAWNGTFSANGGTAQLHFSHVGGSEVNAAMQQQGGRIELTADTDTHFTNTTAAASYEAAGGKLVADKADAAAVESIRATGGDVSLKGLAEATSVSLKELTIADKHSVSASTVNGEMQNAAIEVSGEGSTLTAGVESKLNADLTLGSDATVSIDDRDKGLQINGSLTLSKGSGITLSQNMMNSLLDKGTLVLFSGVTEFTYGDVITTGPVTAYNGVEAQDYFKNLVDIICEQTGRPYFITYSGSGNGGIVAIVPEPTTTTLSLLALAALMARRKRK